MSRPGHLLIGLALGVCASVTAHGADLVRPEQFKAYTGDQRAAHVGDVVTILVLENSSAAASADTSTDKSYGVELRGQTGRRAESAQLRAGDDFGGRGASGRSGRLVAQLTVTIMDVLPNGDLRVQGDQQINIDGEKAHIRLEGRLRARDILADNTALSSRLADARIDYIGDGYLTDRSRPGLLPRIFNWLGLW